jgi:uncharacterized protein
MEDAKMDVFQEKYEVTLQSLISKIRTDPTILAAILLGNPSYDTEWRRTDIDILLVTEEIRLKREGVCLVEAGVNIHGFLNTRSEFRRLLEGSAQRDIHFMLARGRMLFSRDETLVEMFEARRGRSDGHRDSAVQLLNAATWYLPGFTKAEKWFHVKRDLDYCKYWILKGASTLARIETLLRGEIPEREVIHQALRHNPELFHAVYTDMLHGKATEQDLERTLARIRDYLHVHVNILFAPIFSYLREEGELRSITDINHYFDRHYNYG